MKKLFCIILCILAVSTLFAQNKIDPTLKKTIENNTLRKVDAADVEVLIKITNSDLSALEKSGAKIKYVIDDEYVRAAVPIFKITELANNKAVCYITGSRQMQPHNDIAACVCGGIVAAQAGYTGEDVLIGIVDTGLDFKHPGFLNADGSTRVLYFWDQTDLGSDQPTNQFSYGSEWTSADIDGGACTSKDTEGHGTHVAGCAAQHFYHDADEQYNSGTLSNLLIVKTDFNGLHILDGIVRIFQKAEQLGKPAIVNLSLGSRWGPHDGTDPLTAATDLLTGPGKIIVRSAGNDGARKFHNYAIADADGNSMVFKLSTTVENLVIGCWYDGSSKVEAEIFLPGNLSTGKIATGKEATFNIGNTSRLEILNAPYGVENYNGDNNLMISFVGKIPAGEYRIVLFSNDRPAVYAWLYDCSVDTSFAFENSSDHFSLANEACGRNVIVIGAAVTRKEFYAVDEHGKAATWVTHEEEETVASFSSAGPTRDGRHKPDVVMPGSYITTAFSTDAISSGPVGSLSMMREGPIYINPSTVNTFAYVQGTSSSSPIFVSTAAKTFAFFKKKFGHFPGPTDIIDQIIKYAAKPVFQLKDDCQKPVAGLSPVWDEKAGWGYLDLRALLKEDILIVTCEQTQADQLEVQFSNQQGVVENLNSYVITGASESRVVELLRQGERVTLTLNTPLTPGFRDTLKIDAGLDQRLIPIKKIGTIVELTDLTTRMTWDAAHSPYYVHGQIVVYENASLTLLAGTQIEFMPNPNDGSSGIVVLGELKACGEENSPVTILPAAQADYWDGIYIDRKGMANLTCSEIGYAIDAIMCWGGDLEIHHSMIAHAKGFGVFLDSCAAKIDHLLLWDTNGTSDSGSLWIQNTIADNNLSHLTLYQNMPNGIVSLGQHPIIIDSSIIVESSIYAEPYYGSKIIINESDIYNCQIFGTVNESECISADPRFENPDSGDFRLRADSPCPTWGAIIDDINDKNIQASPSAFRIHQNYPNPFNGHTIINFDMPRKVHINLAIYNIRGELVKTLADKEYNTGYYTLSWNGIGDSGQIMSSGIYFCRLSGDSFSHSIRMLYLK
ncbi:S8 family serine peptidase [candidate division KSB1 bacterium]|nr:S8 family serine peptidase [candidate division KSB1 bacterium]